jgi:hypothetical protein
MIFNNILEADNKSVQADLLARCNSIKQINVQRIATLANDHCKATNDPKNIPMPAALQALFDQWYASLPTGTPDYSVYGHDDYIAELWACWKVYSKQHLRNIQKPNSLVTHSIVSSHMNDKVMVDLGCGFAYTTAAITQIFPEAKVYGTNLDGTLQMDVAKQMAIDYGFTMRGDPGELSEEVDLAFASEYFEHFDKPIDHLDYVVQTINPKAMLIANAFGPKAIGHFDFYDVKVNDIIGYEKTTAKATGKLFNERMKHHGYVKVKTKLWNNRPAYWVKK